MAVLRRDGPMTHGDPMEIESVPEPGGYGDGPAYVRVRRAAAGARWPRPGYPKVITEPLCRDPEHDYVWAENSHNAFVRRRWLSDDGVPAVALTVVRPAPQRRVSPP